MSFVHLHVHSHYSILQSSCTVSDLIDKSIEYKMDSVALTDYGNMFGSLEFYFSALDKGIKPILGCEMYYVDDCLKKSKSNNNFRNPMEGYKTLVLLAKNLEGYRNLCRINTKAYQEGFYFVPRVDYKVLDQYKEGLIALTGGQRGRASHFYHKKGKDHAVQEIDKLKSIFRKDLYLTFHPKGIDKHLEYNSFLVETSRDKKIPLVSSNDVHYVNKKDSIVQDVLFCIGTNRTLSDRERSRLGVSEFYFKDSDKMYNMFNDSEFSQVYKEACDRTLEVAEQCSVHFKVKDKEGNPIYHLPKLTQVKSAKGFKDLAVKGLERRFKEADMRGESILGERKKEYKDRLQYELKIIEDMGFIGYFHIVQDFIHWSKNQGIPVGPGRGSGASSLVSYSLGITDLDPMPLNLIFERFLNPKRISMPDFDIDFCQDNRPKVIQYINEKYGADCTSHVITYGRLSVRAAIRDVGRVLGLSYSDVDYIAKLIPDILGINLSEALKKEPRLRSLREEDPQIEELLKLTGMLEGLIRHVGIHAAGIIIADTPIVDYAPLYKGPDNENVIQYDLKHTEKIGLVKFDFLGLKTLTHIKETIKFIEKTKNIKIKIQNISLKDKGIYQIMSQGDTIGVFQFEGHGITDLLIKAQPTCFEDIVAINALYRPGPMSMIPSYLNRKKGRVPVNYIFPELEPILKETYGIIVYQEQVQQIAVEIAGYSYGEADVLRRAMGKKIQAEMARQKTRFLEGAKKKNYDKARSEELFNLMAEFAKYGFNKSHAAAYCVLAAQTAWLKFYYPVEFFASQLSIDQNDSDKLTTYIRDVKKHNISIISPHVNTSSFRFSIEDNNIHFSLGAIKGVGEIAAQSIEQTRQSLPNKKFSTLEEFFENIDFKKINKKTLENLIKSGALDDFGYERKEIYESIEKFTRYSFKLKEDKETGQQSLFSSKLKEQDSVKISPVKSWTEKERLFFEKEVFGFYLNNHPMKFLEGLEKSLSCEKIKTLENLKSVSQTVQTLGMVQSLKEVITKKKGRVMAFAKLEDHSGCLEVIFFPDIYEKFKSLLLKESEVLYFKGNIQNEKSINRLIVENVKSLDDLLRNIATVKIQIDPTIKKQDLNYLKQILIDSKKGSSHLCLETYIPTKKTFVEIDIKGVVHDIEVNHNLLEKMYKVLKTTEKIHFS